MRSAYVETSKDLQVWNVGAANAGVVEYKASKALVTTAQKPLEIDNRPERCQLRPLPFRYE